MSQKTQSPVQLAENTDPTLVGKYGLAWQLDLDAIARRYGVVRDPRDAVSLPCWVARATYAHPIWSDYLIMCVALRAAPGVEAPRIFLEGATHEIIVYALNPGVPLAINDYPHILEPANFAGQFIEADDDAAAARIQQAVQDIIDGTLNPDTDFRSLWISRFGDANLRAAGLVDPVRPADFIRVDPGRKVVMQGTGAVNCTKLQEILSAEGESKADPLKPH